MTAASHSLCPCHHQPDITSTYCARGKRSPSATKRLASWTPVKPCIATTVRGRCDCLHPDRSRLRWLRLRSALSELAMPMLPAPFTITVYRFIL